MPQFCLAEDIDEINPKDFGKYLELPGGRVENLLHSLINIFTSKWINLEAEGYYSAEERVVPLILRKATRIQALNHLLIDAPVETGWGIIKASLKMVRIFGIQDISGVLNELEKQSVQKAVGYGMNTLLRNDIRVTPGAIEFEYVARGEKIEKVLVQYIATYKPSSDKNGEMTVKFYSPKPLKPPENQGSWGGSIIMYSELEHDLPPFIVDVQGEVEDYRWTGKPEVNISFPEEVPDLGIQPIGFWEKHLLKPIEGTIKEVEIIITKITGKSPKFVEIWEDIKKEAKKIISKLNPFTPAAIVQIPKTIENTSTESPQKKPPEELSEIGYRSMDEGQKELEQVQKALDEALKKVDILEQQISEMNEPEKISAAAEIIQKEELEEELEVKDTEETEDAEESEESDDIEDNDEAEKDQTSEDKVDEEIILCEKSGSPARNKVIFNEVAWMGSKNSANDEWIELKNMIGAEINLSGWQVSDNGHQIQIIFNEGNRISLNGFLLLERTDNDSVPGIEADFIYSGALNDSNEALYLFDRDCLLQDEIIIEDQWPAGDKSSRRTMERNNNLNWYTYTGGGQNGIMGTPRQNNSPMAVFSAGSGAPPPAAADPSPVPSPFPIEPENSTSTEPENQEEINLLVQQILITEVQIGTASSTNYDFVELFNPATSSIDISDFQLKKKTSTGSEYSVRVFSENSIIPAQNYFLWVNSEYASSAAISADASSSQTLAQNNSIILLDSNASTIDAVAWGTSTDPFIEGNAFSYNPIENQTIGRKWSTSSDSYVDTDDNKSDFEIQAPTPKAQNQTLEPEPEPESEEEAPTLTVVINEIAWMGTSATNSADEWIELYNNTTSTIDITGWRLLSADGSPDITFSTSTIAANDFYLIERTDDYAVSDILADATSSFDNGLGNSGEKLELRNASGTVIDLVDCSEEWFAGTTASRYVSMERIVATSSGATSTNWASNNLIVRNGLDKEGNKINGTPRAENSVSKSQTEITGIIDYPTLTYLGNPYIVNSDLIIPFGETLEIEPGVILRLNINGNIEVRGTLKSMGEESNKITFTSFDGINYWRGFYFTSSSSNSELEWTEIEYGRRSGGEPPAILVENSSISFKNSTLSKYEDRGLKLINSSSTIENVNFWGRGINVSTVGIEIEGGSPTVKNCPLIKDNMHGILVENLEEDDLPVIEGNNFEDNKTAIYALSPDAVFRNNQGINNTRNGVYIRGNFNKSDLTWYKNNFPYMILDWVYVKEDKKLTIEPGVVVELNSQGYIKVDGTLVAQGTETDNIVFSKYSDYWKTIYFSASSTGSVLENVLVEKGGGCSPYSEIEVLGTSVGIKNATITESNYIGILLENSTSTIESTAIGNHKIGIMIKGLDVFPGLGEELIFQNNEDYDIFVEDINLCGQLPAYLATSTKNNCP